MKIFISSVIFVVLILIGAFLIGKEGKKVREKCESKNGVWLKEEFLCAKKEYYIPMKD